jgi:glucan phosphoethanolaminetransferase (alkaline phosphatase superfamily)
MKLLTQATYFLLAVSAAFVLWVQRSPGKLPSSWESAAPWLFLSFAILLSTQSIVKVVLKQTSFARSFMHIGIAAAFLMVLFFGVPQMNTPQTNKANASPIAATSYEMEWLLVDTDERIRVLAAELARYRPEGLKLAPALAKALGDSSAQVRKAAHASLVHLNDGVDLGASESQDGMRAWMQRFQQK